MRTVKLELMLVTLYVWLVVQLYQYRYVHFKQEKETVSVSGKLDNVCLLYSVKLTLKSLYRASEFNNLIQTEDHILYVVRSTN